MITTRRRHVLAINNDPDLIVLDLVVAHQARAAALLTLLRGDPSTSDPPVVVSGDRGGRPRPDLQPLHLAWPASTTG